MTFDKSKYIIVNVNFYHIIDDEQYCNLDNFAIYLVPYHNIERLFKLAIDEYFLLQRLIKLTRNSDEL